MTWNQISIRGDTESPGYGYGLWVSAALGKGKAKGALGTIDPPNTHSVLLCMIPIPIAMFGSL